MATSGEGARAGGILRSASVGEVGERAVIAALTAAATARHDDRHDLVIGSGDDAAVLDTGVPTVISTDTSVEGRHFRFAWSHPSEVGARAVVQSAADIAAMGGRTTGIVVSIACPPDTSVGTVLDLNEGMVDAAHRLGARLLGGDLVAAREVVVSVTSVGALDGRTPVTLGGARVGDVLAVSGRLGTCAAGLAILTGGDTGGVSPEAAAALTAAFRLPTPDLGQGPVAAAAGAHAMTDISDGLVEELVTMAQACRHRLSVRSDLVPRRPEVAALAAGLGVDVTEWVIAGGEDHELLAAFGSSARVPAGWTVIGTVEAGDGEPEVVIDGGPLHGPDGTRLQGWQSFVDIGDR
ncbi:thiamine-phosphate kinase [Gordonia sp. ABSL1-1]|uniref:thiamine-phosphate kinase n=1 Tax=Gordonia sp. ABSL1-1 TaxID=3053923 RepID=UPI0025734FA8|nr:thiamine-phosphate kinase [Gordonia sp. ABSL1-1]MDL9935565.1 thiamine-phosphate kinase [Gordonia sp. ABSL1-1]